MFVSVSLRLKVSSTPLGLAEPTTSSAAAGPSVHLTSSATLTLNTVPSPPTPKPSPTYVKLRLPTPDAKPGFNIPLQKPTRSNHTWMSPNSPGFVSPCGLKASAILHKWNLPLWTS